MPDDSPFPVNSIWYGTEEEFAYRLQRMIADSGGRIGITSAYRSYDRQAALYAEGIRRYGRQHVNRYVAPPGKSNHNRGLAVDINFVDDAAMAWAHANAARYGLVFPMGHEPWHIEPTGVRDGTYKGQPFEIEAYTEPPAGAGTGMLPPELRKRTFHEQAATLYDILMSPSRAMGGSTTNEVLEPGGPARVFEDLSALMESDEEPTVGRKL